MAKKAKYRFTIFEGTCMKVERRCSLEDAWLQKYGSGSADLGVRISNQDSCNITCSVYDSCLISALLLRSGYSMASRSCRLRAALY